MSYIHLLVRYLTSTLYTLPFVVGIDRAGGGGALTGKVSERSRAVVDA